MGGGGFSAGQGVGETGVAGNDQGRQGVQRYAAGAEFAAVGFAGSATGRTVEDALAQAPAVARRLAEAGTWTASGTAGAYAESGEVDPVDSLAFGLTGLVARDVRQTIDRLWAFATGSAATRSVATGELIDEL